MRRDPRGAAARAERRRVRASRAARRRRTAGRETEGGEALSGAPGPGAWPSRRTVGAILAGGGSTRFGGRPKGLELVGGTRMIDRVAAALRDTTREVVLVANDPAATAWLPGLRVLPDLTPKAGPLAGVQSALNGAAGDAVLVVAWDMPFLTPALLRAIVARGEATGAIVVPEGAPGRAEPVCAYYPATCRPSLDAFLARGERTPSRFLDAQPAVVRLGPAELAAFGDPLHLLSSVNSPADLPS
ncbi:MAG: molybdenum cofactor guanylyltransferase [Gemmatimonadaceae bacterium]